MLPYFTVVIYTPYTVMGPYIYNLILKARLHSQSWLHPWALLVALDSS